MVEKIDSGSEVWQDVYGWDYPDLADAFVSYAERGGVPLTEEELNELNDDSDYIHELLLKYLF